MTTLIIEVTGTDEPPFSAPLPTDLDELNYQRLRFWLIDHEHWFVQLWQDFDSNQESIANAPEQADSDLSELLNNPFSICYRPENLYMLAHKLDMQIGIDIWEPDEYRARVDYSVMIQMGKRMKDFLDWVELLIRA